MSEKTFSEWRTLREKQEEYLSRYAVKSSESKGRVIKERDCPVRTIFERDSNRILYSEDFRRLRHKTQVFFTAKNDHICTRMEHVLHVGSISCTIARTLGLNQDLVQAIAYGHDLGHAPFGHSGEKVLNRCIKELDPSKEFQHERHSLRVVDKLASRIAGSNNGIKYGLNLSYEVRDGIVSHCGERYDEYILTRNKDKDMADIYTENHRYSRPYTLEACVVRLVDKIAYVGRDIEDAVRANLIDTDSISKEITNVLGTTNADIINTLVIDMIENSYQKECIQLSWERGEALKALIQENNVNIYKSDKIMRYEKNSENILEGIFNILKQEINDPEKMKLSQISSLRNFYEYITSGRYDESDSDLDKIVDYIAGMTDNYANKCFEELYWF